MDHRVCDHLWREGHFSWSSVTGRSFTKHNTLLNHFSLRLRELDGSKEWRELADWAGWRPTKSPQCPLGICSYYPRYNVHALLIGVANSLTKVLSYCHQLLYLADNSFSGFLVSTFPGMVSQTMGVWCSGVWRWIHLRELQLETGKDNEEERF